jgi:hypothetical protein
LTSRSFGSRVERAWMPRTPDADCSDTLLSVAHVCIVLRIRPSSSRRLLPAESPGAFTNVHDTQAKREEGTAATDTTGLELRGRGGSRLPFDAAARGVGRNYASTGGSQMAEGIESHPELAEAERARRKLAETFGEPPPEPTPRTLTEDDKAAVERVAEEVPRSHAGTSAETEEQVSSSADELRDLGKELRETDPEAASIVEEQAEEVKKLI